MFAVRAYAEQLLMHLASALMVPLGLRGKLALLTCAVNASCEGPVQSLKGL